MRRAPRRRLRPASRPAPELFRGHPGPQAPDICSGSAAHSDHERQGPQRQPAGSARSAALAAVAVVLAEIAATPVAGTGLSGQPGVHGSFIPVGDLIADGCIVAIALIVIWGWPRNEIGWLMLAFAALGATQNFGEAYGVRAEAIPGAHLPLGPLTLSLGTSLWIPAAALPATLLFNLYPHAPAGPGRRAARANPDPP
jgi:hypothetical protein